MATMRGVTGLDSFAHQRVGTGQVLLDGEITVVNIEFDEGWGCIWLRDAFGSMIELHAPVRTFAKPLQEAALQFQMRLAELPTGYVGETDTWICHVCGDSRPDPKISVHTKPLPDTFGELNRWGATQNIRYCNDRPACIEGAKDVDLVGG